jgi:GH15 family glucan-1,4-alpha-glucosidase
VFGALLDGERGSRFSICPVDEKVVHKQLYWPDTNVLVTPFLSEGGVGEIEDFMPAGIVGAPEWHDQVVRRVSVARGTGLPVHLDPRRGVHRLMDGIYLYNKYGSPISSELWSHLRRLLDWVCDNWPREDEGIWETRGGRQHFVYSKLMCWVALDRGLRFAEKRSFPAPRERWLAERDTPYEEILRRGWSEERQAFVQAYGSNRLDASNLIMPLVFFLAPDDPRMLRMLDQIRRSPRDGGLLSGGLVYRYDPERAEDGLTGREGTFNMCTFWLVEALTRAGRSDRARLDEARMLFERMLGYASHVGLYAEETGPCGEALGNYPQAFTHLALISAAFNLNRALDEGR